MSLMSMQDSCPFCGGITNLQNPSFGNHFHEDGAPNPIVTTPDGIVRLPSDTTSNPSYHCEPCNIDYVPESMPMSELLSNLTYSRNVGMLMDYYYGENTPITDILTNQTVRLFRQAPTDDSFLAKYKSEKRIVFVINYNNKRTSGTILKTGRESYKMNTLEEV